MMRDEAREEAGLKITEGHCMSLSLSLSVMETLESFEKGCEEEG
jgi:hypothetical protein